MALDGATVRPNPGTLTFDGSAIGYTSEGVQLLHRGRHEPIDPEELAEFPLDYINLGGPVLCVATTWQWDAAARKGIASYAISGSSLILSTLHAGKKMSDLSLGVLAFVPSTSGHLGWSADRAVPLIGEEQAFAPRFRRRRVIEFAITFALLPPAAGGSIVTLVESGGV